MDALELAYTPHPALNPRATRMAVAGPARRVDAARGLASAAVASLALFGAAAVLASPRGSQASAPVENAARPFESRAAAAVRPAAEPAPMEARAASPLPFAGDILGPEQEEAVVMPSVASAPREQHVLTSFDGTRTMTDGPSDDGAAPGDAAAQRVFAPAPVVWNHPVQWISVHKQGL